MIWFEYKYTSSSEIIESIKLITEYNLIDFIILWVWIFIIFIFSLYIIPLIKIYKINKKEEKEKRKKKDLIKKILLQKDMEDSISKELNIKD